tara:strand:+ start:324 stop:1163 length:840 start_codon:yes stop_codon:yes gene_type:complete
MYNVIILTGVHPDETILTKTLLNKLIYELRLCFRNNIAIHILDLEDYLSETTVTKCRYRVYNNWIHDLNRVYRKTTLSQEDVRKSRDALLNISASQSSDLLLETWFIELKNNGIDINSLLQGSQTYYNGYLGYTNYELKVYYLNRIIEYVNSISDALQNQKKVTIIDLHSGIGQSGETVLLYQNIITKVNDSSGYFAEELGKAFLTIGINEANVLIVESGVTSTEAYMKNVIIGIKEMIITMKLKSSLYITNTMINNFQRELKINEQIIDEMKDFFDWF